jgi:UTP-glucose-1-phosphate uridylyltransferase
MSAGPTLLVLAAGMGSRYGGPKQIDPVGPDGETIIDYSVYDAIRAGFGKVVFVIRRDLEPAFKENVGRRFEERIAVAYAFQELDDVPAGASVSPQRKKPWGTGQAVLAAREVVSDPFAVINADDFYGADALRAVAGHLRSDSADGALVGFVLRNTLSEFGAVARGICQVTPEGFLESVTEQAQIQRDGARARYTDATGTAHPLTGDETVSMNLWAFSPSIFADLREQFAAFLERHGQSETSELYLPGVVNALIESRRLRVRVLRTSSSWLGVTHRQDRPRVQEGLRALVARGDYPERLWP